MPLQFPEDAPPLLTSLALDTYASYVAARESGAPVSTEAYKVEEALAPLEILYGKTFVSAIAIALYGAEPVIRYVEQGPSISGGQGIPPFAASTPSRVVYTIGDHTLFSPYYCPCSAYAYQSIRRQDVWCCKHLLALQLALKLEAAGIQQENVRVRVVDSTTFNQIVLEGI